MIGIPRISSKMLPPAIDGVIVVSGKHRTAKIPPPAGPASPVANREYWFEAGPGSAWYPWADATYPVARSALVRKDGTSWRLPFDGSLPEGRESWREWGNLIRPGTKMSAKAGRALRTHTDELRSRAVFISYSWSDGAVLAARFAEILSKRGHSAWIDRFSAPRQLAFGLARASEGALGPFLSMALERCRAFAQIRTPDVIEGEKREGMLSWCRYERCEARRHAKPGAEVEIDMPRGVRRGPVDKNDEKHLAELADRVLGEIG